MVFLKNMYKIDPVTHQGTHRRPGFGSPAGPGTYSVILDKVSGSPPQSPQMNTWSCKRVHMKVLCRLSDIVFSTCKFIPVNQILPSHSQWPKWFILESAHKWLHGSCKKCKLEKILNTFVHIKRREARHEASQRTKKWARKMTHGTLALPGFGKNLNWKDTVLKKEN